ncbi:hypothetical protein LMIY3S_05379 [Labrys miyagiensis]
MADTEAGRDADTAHEAQSFDALMRRARLAMAWEQAWPRLALPLGVIGLFLAASWFDLFGRLSGPPRLFVFLVFLTGLIASLWPLARLRLPAREQALARLDRAIGLPHRPATARQDRLAQGSGDPLSEALWRRHRRAALEASRTVRLGVPSPGLPTLDRYGLRVGIALALVVGFFYAGAERLPRLLAALQSPAYDIAALLSGPAAEQPGTRLDAWVTPPPYTRRAPLVLGEANQAAPVAVPAGSILIIRLAGDNGASIAASGGTQEEAAATASAPDPNLVEKRLKLTADASVDITRSSGVSTRFAFAVIPDRPPSIAFDGPVKPDGKGAMTFAYKVDDDYGATSIEAQGTLPSGGHPLYELPKISLPAPAGHARSGSVTATRDLSADPLAGATVKMTLVARDDAGNEGRSEAQDVVLPQRDFTNPLARSLIEQRLKLSLDANQAGEVKYALAALMIAPEDFTKDAGLYLGLRTAWDRLDRANSDDDYRAVADYLWQIANAIEDGDGTLAERQLKAARDKLRDAIARGASPEEIQRLTQELRQAMNNFLKDYAQRQQQALKHGQRPNANGQMRAITPEQLSKLLDQLEKSAREGNKDDAQQLLSQLDDILNNLANPGDVGQGDPSMQQMQQSLNDMSKMILRQQRLRDQTYRQNQPPPRAGQGEEGQDGQGSGNDQAQGDNQGLGDDQNMGMDGQGQQGQGRQGGRQSGQNGQGGQGGNGQGGQPSTEDLRNQQQALRQQLEKMQRDLRESGTEAPDALGEAGQAMRDAEGQLSENNGEDAVNSQGKAIDALRRAAKNLGEQLAQAQRNARGQGQQQGGTRNNGRDPLGRQLPGAPDYGANGSIDPSSSRRAGDVLNELRRRLADPNRPKAETDYLERLLNNE